MVVREYLVENFGFDDSQLKTLGMGKQADATLEADWGSIQILIFPVGTEIPGNKLTTVVSSPVTDIDSPAEVISATVQKQ